MDQLTNVFKAILLEVGLGSRNAVLIGMPFFRQGMSLQQLLSNNCAEKLDFQYFSDSLECDENKAIFDHLIVSAVRSRL